MPCPWSRRWWRQFHCQNLKHTSQCPKPKSRRNEMLETKKLQRAICDVGIGHYIRRRCARGSGVSSVRSDTNSRCQNTPRRKLLITQLLSIIHSNRVVSGKENTKRLLWLYLVRDGKRSPICGSSDTYLGIMVTSHILTGISRKGIARTKAERMPPGKGGDIREP